MKIEKKKQWKIKVQKLKRFVKFVSVLNVIKIAIRIVKSNDFTILDTPTEWNRY